MEEGKTIHNAQFTMHNCKEGYKKTELGWIPNEWEIKQLNDISEIIMGQSPNSDTYNDEGEGIPFFQGKTEFGRISPIVRKWCTKPTKIAKHLDILVSVRAPVGEVNINIEKSCIGRGLAAIRGENNNYKFIYYYMQSIKEKLNLSAQGSTFTAINSGELKQLKIVVPPLKEQQKIAEILSTVDSEIDDTDKLIEKTKELKKGLMQRLLTKGIGHTEFKKTEIGEIPVEWEVKKFSDISKINQGLQIAIEERFKEAAENRLPYITIQYINDKSNIDNQFYIENVNPSVVCYKEDILMTRTGNTGVVVTNEHGVFHNNFFKVDFNRGLLIRDFLVYYLKSTPIQKLILNYAGSTTIPDLKHKDFYRIPVVIPSYEEQKHITNVLTSVDKQIKDYENKKIKLEELKKGLMQQLLTGKVRTMYN